LLSVLSCPLPFELISVDIVSPLNRDDPYLDSYAVIIDHATQFMIAKPFPSTGTCADAKNFVNNYWFTIFAAPHAVLTDNGSCFLTEFSNYITQQLFAYHTFTSPFYPQGNAINEASHKSINRSLSAFHSTSPKSSFREALDCSVLVYNATPHVSTGVSPFFGLLGVEPTLPGWQPLSNRVESADRHRSLVDYRHRAVCRAKLQSESYKVSSSTEFQIGDWVVYQLSDYEKSHESKQSKIPPKFVSNLSLPAKVKEIRDNQLIVTIWGAPNSIRRVPVRFAKRIEGEIPPSLCDLTIDLLTVKAPRPVIHRRPPTEARLSTKWSELLHKHDVQDSPTSRKRAKPAPEVSDDIIEIE